MLFFTPRGVFLPQCDILPYTKRVNAKEEARPAKEPVLL